MTNPNTSDRRLTDRQAAGLMTLVALAIAAAPVALGLHALWVGTGVTVAAVICVAALGVASPPSDSREPPRGTA